MFVAVCDELHLCTEAPSFETLIERVWEIAPDMAQENGLHIDPQNLRLRFAFDQDFTDHRIALGRMGSGFYPQLRDILLTHGCTFVRNGKGSHQIWRSAISEATFPVAVTIMSRHLANQILKQAGITQRFGKTAHQRAVSAGDC